MENETINNDKVLLMMPHFMGYDDCLKAELEKRGYKVNLVNNEANLTKMQDKIYASFSIRQLIKISKKSLKWYSERIAETYLEEYDKIINRYCDYAAVLVINGHYMPDKLYARLREKIPIPE